MTTTRATIKKPGFSERLITAAIALVVAAVLGLPLLAFQIIWHLGLAIVLGGSLFALATLTGVDDIVSYLSGQCPHCSKPIRGGLKQKKIVCPHCRTISQVVSAAGQHEFKAD